MQPSLEKRLTSHAKNVLNKAKKESKEKDLKKINAIFLVKPLINQKGSLGKIITQSFGLSGKDFLEQDKIKEKSKTTVFDILIRAFQIASSSKSPYVGTEHLVHALLNIFGKEEKIDSTKIFQQKFNGKKSEKNFNKPLPPDFLQEMNSLLNSFFSNPQKNGGAPCFDNFCLDLNKAAKENDHVLINRERELERISNILGRKTKNNPILIGEPGVGKTAIVEGLAQKINDNKAPFYMQNKTIFTLDLGLLVAGTNFRGEFESRLKDIIAEAKRDRRIILFIDEIHNLVGAGNAIGGMDAANLLKPALSRGEIQVIGATTFDEYRKHIEKDAALERRFQPITVPEPTEEETLKILKGIKYSYENYHNITISEQALATASNLAKRYFTDRFLPDSAIDLIDETSAQIRSKIIHSDLYNQLKEKEIEIENLAIQKEELVMTDRYEDAIQLRATEKKLAKEIKRIKLKINKEENNHSIRLTEEDIHKTIANNLQIPLSFLDKKNQNIPLQTKKTLQKSLVGQNETIKKIHTTLLRQFSGIANPEKPLGSFLFIGPSGVGKTLAAKLLAQSISYLPKDNLIQINMSEFMEKHSVSKLLGSPAGYVGYDESSTLLEKVRRNPYSIVLFDEIEKADNSVLNILLQILEEGKMTDSKGRDINFRNSIIILTSNIGTARLNEVSQIGFESGHQKAQEKKQKVEKIINKELENNLSLELINRLDSILIFNNLSNRDILKITKKELEILAKRLKNQNIVFEFDLKSQKLIAKKSFDPKQGARLVKKQIEENIEPLLAEVLIKKETNKKQRLLLTVQKNSFIIRNKK